MSSISGLPSDTLEHNVFPFLNVVEILHLISTSQYLFVTFTQNADKYWKDQCTHRWRSILFDAESLRQSQSTVDNQGSLFMFSPWLIEYKRQHLLDRKAEGDIDAIVELEKNKSPQERGNKANSKENAILWSGVVSKDRNLDLLINLCKTLTSNTMVTTTLQSSERRSTNDGIKDRIRIVKALLEGIHRLEICVEFKNLAALELSSFSTNSIPLGSLSIEERQDNDDVDMKPKLKIEYGAMLIAKFYQNAQDIVQDYDIIHGITSQSRTNKSFESGIDEHFDLLALIVKNRLKKRYTDQNNGRVENESFRWPIRWVLEEMKILFKNPAMSESSITQVITQFEGNEEDYYLYTNSLINKVIESRKGMPITLSVIYAAIVERVSRNVEIIAADLPGHFMLFTEDDENNKEPIFIDVFHGGSLLSKLQVKDLIFSRYNIEWSETFLDPVLFSEVWLRMMRNLKNCHKISAGQTGSDTLESQEETIFQCKMTLAINNLMLFPTYSACDKNKIEAMKRELSHLEQEFFLRIPFLL